MESFLKTLRPIRIPILGGFRMQCHELSLDNYKKLAQITYGFMEFANSIQDIGILKLPDLVQFAEVKWHSWEMEKDSSVKVIQCTYYQKVKKQPGVYFVAREANPERGILGDFLKEFNPEDYASLRKEEITNDVSIPDGYIEKAASVVRKYVHHSIPVRLWGIRNRGNLFDMDNIISRYQLCERNPMPGKKTPYVYCSSPFSSSPMHTEDFNLDSYNVNLNGCSKMWVIIPKSQTDKYYAHLRPLVPCTAEEKKCPAFLMRHRPLIKLETLRSWGVEYLLYYQQPGEVIFLRSGVPHQVVNLGVGQAKAVNYADERYLPIPPKYRCRCKWEHQRLDCYPTKGKMDAAFNAHKSRDHGKSYYDHVLDLERQSKLFEVGPINPMDAPPVVELYDHRQSGAPRRRIREESPEVLDPRSPASSVETVAKKSKTEKEFRCEHCEKVYPQKCRLNAHVQTTHLKQYKSAICTKCGKTFSSKSNCYNHINNGNCHGSGRVELNPGADNDDGQGGNDNDTAESQN